MEFGANAAINHIGLIPTIVHAHVIFVLEALNLCARNTLRHRLVPTIYLIVYSRDWLVRVAHGERVHFRTQTDELDDRIALGLVLEVSNLFGVENASGKSEVGKMAHTDLAEVKGVGKPTARLELLRKVLDEEVKEERVGVRVQHSYSIAKNILKSALKEYL